MVYPPVDFTYYSQKFLLNQYLLLLLFFIFYTQQIFFNVLPPKFFMIPKFENVKKNIV